MQKSAIAENLIKIAKGESAQTDLAAENMNQYRKVVRCFCYEISVLKMNQIKLMIKDEHPQP